MTKEFTFDDIEDATLDDVTGDGHSVLSQGLIEHTAEALATPDFLTAGKYKVAGMDGMWELWIERDNQNRVRTHTFVKKWAQAQLAKEIAEQKQIIEDTKGESGAIYVVPPWEFARMQFEGVIDPDMTEEQIERAIYKHAPGLWINHAKAPRF